MEVPAGIEPACAALQAAASPLGQGTVGRLDTKAPWDVEPSPGLEPGRTPRRRRARYPLRYDGGVRAAGIEPATFRYVQENMLTR